MFASIEEFMGAWKQESDGTRKIMGALTDESLKQAVADDHRTLARMAWHIIGSIPEMMNRTGLEVNSAKESDPIPTTAEEIKKAYDKAATTLAEEIKTKWADETLQVEDDIYGETWKRGLTLGILVNHEIHHRGQMTVLMRQAGLKVPGVYGPAKEEWVNYKMEPPAV
jgi:uncharacterized damage-inducible protein DinB